MLRARERHCGGGDVHAADHIGVGDALPQAVGPGRGEWHSYAAVEEVVFAAAKRGVVRPVEVGVGLAGMDAAVVAQKEDEGVVAAAGVFKSVKHAAYVCVERVYHSEVCAAAAVGDMRVFEDEFGRRLQGGVGRVVGEV